MMTQKDYILLAAALASVDTDTDSAIEAWHDIREAVANVLAADNPRFDRGRFNAACITQAIERWT